MKQCRHIGSLVAAVITAGVVSAVQPAAAQPSADQVLTDMGLSADDRQNVLNGQFVTADVPPVSERDLSIAIAFVVQSSPADLSKQIVAGDLIAANSQIQAHGALSSGSSLADFAGVQMTSDTAQAFAGVEAGSSLNLSTSEIAAFNALQSGDTQGAQRQLQKMLLARFQSYKSSGLAGIAPYDRGGSTSDPAADLRRASDAARGLKKYLPAFQKALAGYPQASVPDMTETFNWFTYNIDGKATYVLTHGLAVPEGAARIVVQRQFYVSTGYNAEQAVAAFLPVQEGTVVVYTNHTFTDQVAGFGGSMKRSIGRGMMEKQLKEIFEKAQTMVQP